MNRVKKELRKRGLKLSHDYPHLPYYIKGKSCFEPGYVYIEDVYVNSEKATLTQYTNVGLDITWRLNRNGKLDCE